MDIPNRRRWLQCKRCVIWVSGLFGLHKEGTGFDGWRAQFDENVRPSRQQEVTDCITLVKSCWDSVSVKDPTVARLCFVTFFRKGWNQKKLVSKKNDEGKENKSSAPMDLAQEPPSGPMHASVHSGAKPSAAYEKTKTTVPSPTQKTGPSFLKGTPPSGPKTSPGEDKILGVFDGSSKPRDHESEGDLPTKKEAHGRRI